MRILRSGCIRAGDEDQRKNVRCNHRAEETLGARVGASEFLPHKHTPKRGHHRRSLADGIRNRKTNLAAGDQIFAVPTLVRRLPEPIKKIIGDLSNEERVLVGLEILPIRT